MTGWNDAYPYTVNQWATKPLGGSWRDVTDWLDRTVPGEWEYFNSEFRFRTERAKMLFLLRWS